MFEGDTAYRSGNGGRATLKSIQRVVSHLTTRLTLEPDDDIHTPSMINSPSFWKASPYKTHDRSSSIKSPLITPGEAPRVNIQALVDAHRRWCKCYEGSGCYIEGAAATWTAVRVPFRSPVIPSQHPPIQIEAKDVDFVRQWLLTQRASGVISPVDPKNESKCTIVSPIFVAYATKLRVVTQDEKEAIDTPSYSTPLISQLAEARARSILEKIQPGRPGETARAVDRQWKQESIDKRRVVLDLSVSLNCLTAQWPFKYYPIDHLVEDWSANDHLYSCDLSQGFHQMVIHPDDRRYFCFSIQEGILEVGEATTFCYNRLPFGWNLSPSLFASLTNEIQLHVSNNAPEAIRHKLTAYYYVDDLCLRTRDTLMDAAVSWAKEALKEVEAATNHLKETLPKPSIIFCGRQLDSPTQQIRVAAITLFTTLCIMHLIHLLSSTPGYTPAVSLKKAFSVAGKTSWLAELYYSGRLYAAALFYPPAEATRMGWGYINIQGFPGYINAIEWWLGSVRNGSLRGHKLVRPRDCIADFARCPTLQGNLPSHTRSDASGTSAWALVYKMHVLWAPFTPEQLPWTIQAKELLPVLKLLEWGGESLRGSFIAITTHNISNVCAINLGKGKGVTLRLLRSIYALCDALDIDIIALWLPREQNEL